MSLITDVAMMRTPMPWMASWICSALAEPTSSWKMCPGSMRMSASMLTDSSCNASTRRGAKLAPAE